MTTEKKEYNSDLVACFYPSKKGVGSLYATGKLSEIKGKRYLLEPVKENEGVVFKMYISKIGGLEGKQIRDLDNYDAFTTFYERKGKFGPFYVSTKGDDGKRFILNKAKEGKDFSYVLTKDKEAYTPPEKVEGEETPKAEIQYKKSFA